MPRGPLHYTIFRFAVLLFVAWIVVAEFPGASGLIRQPYSGIDTKNLVVQNVDPSSPNAGVGIQRNDEIVAVDGARVRNYNHFRYLIRDNHGLVPQTYTLQRGDDTVAVTVRYIPAPSSFLYRRFGLLLVAFTFLLTGLLVLLRRNDAVGILFSLNCANIAFVLTDRPILASPWLQLLGELFGDAVTLFFPAVFLHFFLVFKDRPHGLDTRGRIRRALMIYCLPAAIYGVTCIVAIRQFYGLPVPADIMTPILAVSTVYVAVYVILSLLVFIRNYRASSPAQKQKKRIAILGTIVGILPFLFVVVWRQVSPGPYTLWEFLSVIALGFVSVSFAYAILKHGAIELNIVVRKSLAYAFLSGAVIAAYYALVNVLGDYLMSGFGLKPAYFSIASILVLAIIFAPARELVQRLVDRVFLRGDYDYKHEVVEFNRQLTQKLKRTELLDYASGRIRDLLKTSFVAFYAPGQEGDPWTIERVDGKAPTLPTAFPRSSLLGRYLSRYKKPLMVEYLDYSWGRRYLDETSTAFLSESHAAVCLPIRAGGSIAGLIALGPKRSGQLYNHTDSLLLDRFTEHLGLVLENAELHEASFEQERLKNEVMLAREIQLSLLPTKQPRHKALSILGTMVSSEEVGGDYFDYFALEPNQIGVAIGDVRGKGVPAAMLMSSLQAVFKNLAQRERMSPGNLVDELNRYLCGNAKTGQFATFFYGVFDLDKSTFVFSNAGHCPALLIKRDFTDRLGEGGMPLGVDPEQRYEEALVRIDVGDMLCFYTDGVTEQASANDDLYGEQRLIDFLRANKNLPLSEIQESLFAAVIGFGDGRQDDDFTTIIALHTGD